ncbi:MAG TPA: glycosyltransferase, partial [Aggregatilineaceae bacterium]|nr:glycosyltransferase [Aggregatilineaceae bacterium]
MKLLIISHTEHYDDNGLIKGWGPTVREIDYLSELFDEVVHIAPLHTAPAPGSTLAYQSKRVALHLVPPSGGPRLQDKVTILTNIPRYVSAMVSELRRADVVHVRCPANISLIALVVLTLARRPRLRWIKYAGNWQPKEREALSYTLQRWCLTAQLPRAIVTVNGQWPGQPAHVHSFVNPCLTDEELQEAEQLRGNGQKQLTAPARLLFVGQLNIPKGAGRAIEILAELQRRRIEATLDFVGDGEARPTLEAQAQELKVASQVKFHGWLPRQSLGPRYAQAHLMVFPTDSSEGWPKVLSEGMAYGVVPLSGNVSSIPQFLENFGVGRALDPYNIGAFVEAVSEYVTRPAMWKTES